MKKKETGSVVSGDYEYTAARVRDKTGKIKHTRNNDDAIARAMLLVTAGAVSIERVIRDNKLGSKYEPAKYDNKGLLRMSVGNSLRGLVRNGTHVTIGDLVVKSLEQRVAVPEVKDAPAAKKAAPKKAKAKKAAKPRKKKSNTSGEATTVDAPHG